VLVACRLIGYLLTFSVKDVNTNETFTCTLGPDPSIGITYTRTATPAKVEGGAFAEQTRSVVYTTTITLRNAHSFTLPAVHVKDSLPLVGDDKRMRVVVRKPVGLADAGQGAVEVDGGVKCMWAKKGGEKEGMVEWVADIGAREEVKMIMEYEVRGPVETGWALRAV
jgi:hypothetical protein